MKQYALESSTLKLKVKKSPVLVRAVMFGLTFFSFIFPVLIVIDEILTGSGLKFGYFIG